MDPLSLALLFVAIIAIGIAIFVNRNAKSKFAADLARETAKSAEAAAKANAELGASERRKAELQSEVAQAHSNFDRVQRELSEAQQSVSRLEALIQSDRENQATNKTLLAEQFTNLANQILEDKSRRFTESNKSNIETTLGPLKERLAAFEKKVEETYDKESQQRFSLKTEITNLIELNARISTEANNLTNALKGQSKARGNWGEMILERLLEMSGLEKGREYEVQVSKTDEDGNRFQPDIVLHLPGNKQLVIDSKVNLNAYERYCSIEDGEERKRELKNHCEALRRHIKDLGAKKYHDLEGLETVDFVLLFVPIEPAFMLASQHDLKLYEEALAQNVVVVCPSTLHPMLRTIVHIWRQEKQNQNVHEIVRKASALHDKFCGLYDDLLDVEKKLLSAQSSLGDSMKKARSGKGNLVSQVAAIKKLGARSNKSLPPALLDEAMSEEIDFEEEVTGAA